MSEALPDTVEVFLGRRHPLAKCEVCPLNNNETVFVPSSGPAPAKYAAIGEAPGFQEANKGQPFVGPSGQLLMRVLAEYGIRRQEVFLSNTCLCRPPQNATPPAAAVAACRPRLMAELEQVKPEVLFALGGPASQTVLNTQTKITTLRVGPGKTTEELPGTLVIPTWHPAYCLRTPDAFPDLVSDIAKFRVGKRPAWVPPEYHVLDDETGTLFVIMQLMDTEKYPKLVVDIESAIEKDVSFDHPELHDMLCVGICYAKGKVVVIGEEALKSEKVADALMELFKVAKLVGQNLKFDNKGLFAYFKRRFMPSAWFDTMLADYTLDERPGRHSLGYLGVELLGMPDWKHEIAAYTKGKGSYALVPRPILYRYNAYDVGGTWDLMEYFEKRLAVDLSSSWPYDDVPYKSLRDVHDFLVRGSNELQYLELNGIGFDMVYSRELEQEYLKVLDGIEDKMNDIVTEARRTSNEDDKFYVINPRSPKQVKEFLHERGAKVNSTNQDTLERLRDKQVRPGTPLASFINTLLEHRNRAKRYGTYVKGMQKRVHGGRIHTTYLLHQATSGRLASRNPNLQNIVRDKLIKNQFTVVHPDNLLIGCDYKQAEGRVIAWLAKDEYLREKFADPNVDIFDDLSDDLYGIGNWTKAVERVRTKAFFYGIGYGRTAYSIALEYDMSPKEAERKYEAFMELIPATVEWQRLTRQRVRDGNDLITPFGRHRRFRLITQENEKDVMNEALSFIPQSTASDICLSALIRLRPMLRGKAFIRLTIHDALYAEAHKDKAEEVAAIMRQVMIEEAEKVITYVPFDVDTSFGTRLGQL